MLVRRRLSRAGEEIKALGYENVETASWEPTQEVNGRIRKHLIELGIYVTQPPLRALGRASPTRNFALAYLSEPRRTSKNSSPAIAILSSKNNDLKVLH